MADEVTDRSNWEQLGIVVCYRKDSVPVEKLLEYVKCENIREATIADLIIDSVTKVGLNPTQCRSQTYDRAENIAGGGGGGKKGAARQFVD